MKTILSAAALAVCAAAGANAAVVQVSIHGQIDYNVINSGPLNNGDVPGGSDVTWSFLLDSTQYMNDPDGLPTRGYFIDQSSFKATFNGVTIGLQNPFPDGQLPMFVLRDNDPAVDGFFLSTGTAWSAALPTSLDGRFGPLGTYFLSTYENNPLSSLDILGAVGTYNFDGLTVFGFRLEDGPFAPMEIVFDHMTIAEIPAPATLGVLAPLALVGRRRRN